jgi:regulator of protease activity HflC (stomatin/prohibitin superfamily)
VIVLAWERGVLVRLGRNARILEPGFHWRIPYLDEVRTLNNRFRIACFPCATISTRDGKVMTCAGNVGFRIADPRAALLALSQPDDILAAMAQSAIAELVAERTAQDLTAAYIEARALASLRDFGAARGLEVEFVRLVDFAAVRAIRLLQGQWRPRSHEDAGH